MVHISKFIKEKPEGSKEFPIYRVDSIESGKVFAEASMGFMGAVSYAERGNAIAVRTTSTKPIMATLGCQLAGWTAGNAMISGPVRLQAKKPGFIFDKVKFGRIPQLPPVACVEGDEKPQAVISELKNNGIMSAEILWTSESSKAQYINIPARAIEIVLFRLLFSGRLNDFRLTKTTSLVTAKLNLKDPSSDLNDAIRFNGKVLLMGNFRGFTGFKDIVTKNTEFAEDDFADVMKECGSVANCPIELFSVGELTVVDSGRTTVY